MTGRRRAPGLHRSLSLVALALVLVWTLFPIWWAFALSIKHPSDFFTAKMLPFVQFSPTLNNWRDEWQAFDDPAGLGHGLVNSLIVATVTSGLSVALGSLAAFGLVLMRRGRHSVWRWIALLLVPRILPPVVLVIPFMLLVGWLGLTDTLPTLIIAHTTFTLPLAVLILYGAISELPGDLLDAAQMDGCGLFATFHRIVVPLSLPALLATGALCFAQSWNEFLFAVANVQQRAQTAPLAIAALLNKDGIEFEYVGSHLLMVTLPPLILAFLAQRYIVRGLSLGVLKDEVSG